MKKCSVCENTKLSTEFSRRKSSLDGLNHKCKVCQAKYLKVWQAVNIEAIAINDKKWRLKNPLYIKTWRERTQYNNVRYKVDPLCKLAAVLRSRIYTALKVKNFKKLMHFNEYIGCTSEELKSHIEKQFQPGMTWDNHTIDGWHVDHIIPLASATTAEEMIKLCHYTNLQPLWAIDNLKKNDKLVQSLEE